MKKQNFSHFIGVDIAKLSFDVAIINNLDKIDSYVFDNTKKGIKAFLRLLKNQNIDLCDCLICMEHTGIYGKLIITSLVDNKANICVEMSLKIMRSLGIQRGKNDKIDAIRIAKYVAKNYLELELYQPVPEILDQIKTLITIRERLVKSRADLTKYPNELEHFAPNLSKLAKKNIKKSVKTFTEEIKRIEEQIHKLILSDDRLHKTIDLASSVTGIGVFTALYLTIYTNFFTRYSNPKQLACYCGVVPFEHSSGTSIHKRARVHHMANKTLKKQLHLCALAAMTYDPQLKAYYTRKVEEGKSKMLVINNIRNKLVHRVCAVIKRQQPYKKVAA
ncbi:IS110 family transposase [Aquimarina sp. MMG016]|uniref:IS110 family transposase n=1 Tax=Aquimarina sp. MMG016 TaxID=2822690 RepID=UPI001B3A0AC7|nr:IS110 family transposase [Aquimarina sp. MMG016]MBQ4819035.1 IS110 family transposase [Aquimarina sp. MMG016]